MECIEAAELAEKYEFGEISGYKKKKFEYHVKNCKKCNKKYGALLLLGAVMSSSVKCKEVSSGSSLIAFSKSKGGVLTVAALIAVGSTGICLTEKNKNEVLQNTEIQVNEERNNFTNLEEKNSVKKQNNETKGNGLKIISKYETKEIEITVDKESFRQNNRIER